MRFVVHADEKLSVFLELQAAIHRQPASSQSADGAGPRFSTHEAGISPRHAEGDGLTGLTSDGGLSGGVTSDAGGMPVTRARIPWAMPEASV
jgi:hypothetical protein